MKRKIITVIIMSLLLVTSVFNYRVYAARPTLQWIENEKPYNLTDAEKQLAKSYAAEIKEMKNNGKITYGYGYDHKNDHKGDGAFSDNNISDTAEGKAAKRSNYGTNKGGSVYLSPYLLKAIIDLTDKYGGTVQINEISGADHSSNSLHYYGIAADLGQIGGDLSYNRGKEAYNYLVGLGYELAPVTAGTLCETSKKTGKLSHYHLAVTGYKCIHISDPNSEINRTGYCSEDNAWLQVDDDDYAYNQDGSLFVPGTYKEIIKNGSSVAIYRNQPYKSSPSLNINFSTVEVIGCVKNGLGNVWYKVKNGTNIYYCFSENLEFVSPIDSTLSINPNSEIYTIQKGTSCNVLGTISSNYNITRVTATLNGTEYVNKTPNSKTFAIGTSSPGYINSFEGAKLPVGNNYIKITATDASGKTISKTITIKVEDNSQSTPETYQIIYNANEGGGIPNNQTKTQGVPLYLSTTIPAREHHTFLGYSTYLGGPIVYQPGDAYTADSGATLYANWAYNYGFQVIGVLDGTTTYSTAEYGTYDIYINGSLVAQNATDYWNEFPTGTTYEVVLHLNEHYWIDTVNSSSLKGTINNHTPIYLGINTNQYPLDLNAIRDGQQLYALGENITCDLYINGQLEAEGISDHYQYYKYGTSYEFKNFRTKSDLALESIATAEEYNNETYKNRRGTIEGPTNVNVKMHTCYKNSDDYRDNISKVEEFNGHTYLYFDSELSWYDANSICKLLGGHLVTLNSEEENAFIGNFSEYNIIWTGGLCNANREWKWVTDEDFSYSNWDMNWGLAQPNNGNDPGAIEGCEEYIMQSFNENSKGYWHDDAGSHHWNFVCEIDDDLNEFIAKTKKCGEDVTYTISDDNVLVIAGNGDTYNYSINNKAPWHDNNIEQVIIEDGVTSIGDFSFYDCSNLTSIKIPDSVISVGDSAFDSCLSLTSITIPNSVTSIGNSAFSNCISLATINISSSVTSIGICTFDSCESLTSINIPDSVTTISETAFFDCASLTSINLPNSLTSIGVAAFKGCNLTSVKLGPYLSWPLNLYLPSGNWTNGSITYTAKELHDNWDSSLAGTWKKIDEKVSNRVVNGTLEKNGTISLKVACEIDENVDRDNAYVLINNEKTYLKDLNKDGNNYTLKIPQLSPKHLSDNFTVTYYDKNDKPISDNVTISVKSYINSLINDENTSTKAKTFYKSLLNYAANAQEYFRFNTEDLANSELSEADKGVSNVNKEEVAEYAPSIAGVTEGIRTFGQDLNIAEEIDYRIYFQLEDGHNINEYVFTLDGVNVKPQKYSNNMYYVNTEYHAAPDLGVTHNIAVTRNNEGSLNVSVSVISYAHLVLRNEAISTSNIQLQNLMKSLYLYYNNAKQMLEG